MCVKEMEGDEEEGRRRQDINNNVSFCTTVQPVLFAALGPAAKGGR